MSDDLTPLGEPTWETPAVNSCAASILMPVHDCAAWVGDALRSVLHARDLPLDVLVLDDASSDATAAAVMTTLRSAPAHPHRVRFWTRQPHRGLNGNAALTAAAATDFCIVQHGDDIGEADRPRRLVELFHSTGADVLSTNVRLLDAGGMLSPRDYEAPEGFVSAESIATHGPAPTMLGAALAWRRRLFADFPALHTSYLFIGHDTLTAFRGALRGGFYYSREPLLRYRQHAGQWSHRLSDMSSTAASTEINLFRFLCLRRAMASDCRHRLEQHDPAAERIRALLALIDARQLELIDFFITHRESMLRTGRRPLWVEAREFDQLQHQIYRERFWARGRWRRLRAWWRDRRRS